MSKAIDIQNFSYAYPDGTKALSDISMSISHGEKVALIGPNGAGKSTLLLAMSVFIKGAGQIKLDDTIACPKNAKEIRKTIGSVLSNPDDQFFMPTLFDDVASGPMNMALGADEIRKRTADALRTVGLVGMENKAPHHLSAGQKRSAAIATILSMNPKIITMDEPDSSLDPRSRNNLLALLGTLSQTLVIATCSMDFAARLCRRAILIDKGKIIADGSTEKIMTDSSLMENHGLEVPAALHCKP